jgi:RNA polymerase sigma-B factor
VACLGLIKAIDRFDLERGIAFSSYAVPTMLGEIKRHFRDRTWAVRVPRDLQELSLRVGRAAAHLTVTLRRRPTIAEISEEVGVGDAEVLKALEVSGAYKATSLHAPRGGDEDEGDSLGDTITIDDACLQRAEDRAVLAHLMRRVPVPVREREVLLLRFVGDLTQAEIGQRIGLSQMQVSRIIRQAIWRLQATTDTGETQAMAA